MNIAIGSDHAGVEFKEAVIKVLRALGHDVADMGTNSKDSVHYPDFAKKVADAVADGKAERGVLICGTGIGMSMAANRNPKIRAALCNDVFLAKMSRLHNDANILCMGARVIGPGLAEEIIRTFFATPFEAGRHEIRIKMFSK